MLSEAKRPGVSTVPNAIVIGAGAAGISTAIRLALKGYVVEVFEASSGPGGKISELNIAGYRFDMGPSLFTMPQYVDELFNLAGRDPRRYYRYERLEHNFRYFFEDGTVIDAHADVKRFAAEIAKHTSDTAESVMEYFDKSRQIYEITNPVFLQRSLHRVRNYLNLTTLRSLLRFPQIDPFRTMDAANSARFKDPRTIRIFNRYATYNGSDPYQAPATLNVIPHFEQHFGAYFPEGGMYAIVNALVALASELGVIFHFNKRVDQILVESGRAGGVKVDGEEYHAAKIVSNIDIWHTYRKLLPGVKAPGKILDQERSSSALIFYWGIADAFPTLQLHNIFFSEDYRREFGDIWSEKIIPLDPTVYVNISSKLQPADSPAGCENWFVMINVPPDTGQDWDGMITRARKQILEKLSTALGRDIAKLIVAEEILDPRGIDVKTGSYQGSLYGTSSNNRYAAFLRHANFSSKIRDLYFVGGSVHPGGGIPLALLSARIVDEII